MDKIALVSTDLERGAEIVRKLDEAALILSVALWAYLPKYEDWRLVVSARTLDTLKVREAYRAINDSLDAGGLDVASIPPIVILPTTDPFVKALRAAFAKARNVEGMRLSGQMIGNRFLEDAYVYRIR
jgi:hypothetical protein